MTNSPVLTIVNEQGVLMTQSLGSATLFSGIVFNPSFNTNGTYDDRIIQLLIRAFNNRTRERNYFKLYSQMLEGDVTEEYFRNEIVQNKDDYVVPAGHDDDSQDIYLANYLAPQMKSIHSADDFISIFSFCDCAVVKLLG
jgi:hypothetical protein